MVSGSASTGPLARDGLRHAARRFANGPIFVLGFLTYVAVFYPGFMSTDSADQILQARSGLFHDWNPPLMAHIWRLAELAIAGPAGMLVLQSALVWFGSFLIYRAFFAERCGPLGAAALAVLLFFPPVFGIAGTIWKDILMWGLLLVALGLAGHVGPWCPGTRWRSGLLLGSILLLCLAAALTRYNAIFATIPVIAMALVRAWDRRSAWALVASLPAAAAIAGALLLAVGPVNARLADIKANAWVTLAVFDVSGIVVRLPDRSEQAAIFERIPLRIRGNGDIEALEASYTPRNWLDLFTAEDPAFPAMNGDPFKQFQYLNQEELSAIRSLWFSVLLRHWDRWLEHRLAVSEHVLGLAGSRLYTPVFFETNGFRRDLEDAYGRNPEPTELQKILQWRLGLLEPYWIFRPWFYLLLAVAALLISLPRVQALGPEIVLVPLCALTHELALLALAPSPDYRYSHVLVYLTCLALLLLARPWIAILSARLLGAGDRLGENPGSP